jgi:phage terminase large subunit-like protein
VQNDLNNEDLEYYFDHKEADKYINFIEKLSLTESKWAGKPFILELWQAFIIANIFGWKKKGSNLRRYDEVTIHVPKKNGKTALAAAIAIAYAFLEKNDYAGQIYMAATNREQANICFKAVKRTIQLTEGLEDYFRVMQYAVISKRNDTNIKALSGDAPSVEGFGSSLVIFDEYHLQKTDELKENLITGQAARDGALFISISTAGTDKNAPYFRHIQACKNVLNGISKIDSHLTVIYEADSKDWRDNEVWQQANPNYGVSVNADKLEKEFLEADEHASKQPSFITKHLNIWADSSSTWIDSDKWKSCGQNLTLSDYYGREAYIGIDLGSTGDFSALVIFIPDADKYLMFSKFWIPKEMAKKRTKADQINFTEWARQGHIQLTEGDATDYNEISNYIINLCSNFKYKPIAYDKHMASMMMIKLHNENSIQVESYSQAITSVSSPTKQLYEWITTNNLIQDNNPVMAWMISNIEVYNDDANGNYKIHKGKSKNKVDGPCAAVNAIGRYLELQTNLTTLTKYVTW